MQKPANNLLAISIPTYSRAAKLPEGFELLLPSVRRYNILIIKPGAIGDLLQLTPVIRALHGKYPGARISIMVGSAATASLFTHNPLVQATCVNPKLVVNRPIEDMSPHLDRRELAKVDAHRSCGRGGGAGVEQA
jgi:3-deoxy-D-manno-octulosonic-acid transferase